jgi:hypothetical protein
MNKIFLLILGSLLFGMKPNYWSYYDTIYLKKDYTAKYNMRYKEVDHTLKFRFTLFINNGIVMHYNYEKFPYQNILYTDSLRSSFKKNIVDFKTPKNPYFLVVFKDYSDKIATFDFLIFNPDLDVRVELNNTNLRNKQYVQNLRDNE